MRSLPILILAATLAASNVYAGCKLTPVSVSTTMADHFKDSVVKVVYRDAASSQELGSAFLIDNRGYFMTAAHVVFDPAVSEVNERGSHSGMEVVLSWQGGDIYIPATVVAAEKQLDIALLSADLSAAYIDEGGVHQDIDAKSLLYTTPRFPLRVGLIPVVGERGHFVGYRREGSDGTGRLIFDAGEFKVRQASDAYGLQETLLDRVYAPDLVAEGEVFEGHSGSPLVDENGYVFAVVTSYDVPRKQELDYYQLSEDLRRRRIRATHMLFASWLLDEGVPMTPEADIVSQHLRGKHAITSNEEAIVIRTSLSPLSWLTLTAEIMRYPEAYLPALKGGKRIVQKLYHESVEHCVMYRADPWIDFLEAHKIDPRGQSLSDIYEQFKRMRESGASDAELRGVLGPSIDAYRMELARDPNYGSFEVAELPAEVRGRLNRELAELQLAALQVGDDSVSISDVNESLMAALGEGGADPVTLRTVASAAFVERDYDLALASLALARRAAPSQVFAEGVEQDYDRIAGEHLVGPAVKIEDFDRRWFESVQSRLAERDPQQTPDLSEIVAMEAAMALNE